MRQHHPQGVAPDGARLILHDPPIKKKAPLRRFFRFCGTELNLPDENLPQHQPQGGRACVAGPTLRVFIRTARAILF